MTRFLPVLAEAPPERRRGWIEAVSLPFVVGLLGIAVSLLLWRALRQDEQAENLQRTAARAAAIHGETAARMEGRLLPLVRMAARWAPEAAQTPEAVAEAFDREEWEQEAGLYLSHYPGFHSIYWISPDGRVRWRVPSEAASGGSVADAPSSSQAMNDARQARTVRLIGSVPLSRGQGFIAFSPMFEGDRFGGWIAGAFLYESLFDAILGRITSGYQVTILHDGVPVYRLAEDDFETRIGPVAASRITLFGSPFKLETTPAPGTSSEAGFALARTVLISGLLVAFLLALGLYFAQDASQRARALARERDALGLAQETLEQQRAQLAEAQAIARLGRWEWDMTVDRVQWSDEMYRIFGVERGSQELSYGTFLGFVHPEDREKVSQVIERLLVAEAKVDHVFRIVRPDGSERYLHARRHCVRDDAGRPIRLFGTSLDITELKEAEGALRESEARFRLLADRASDLIIQFKPEGEIVYASPAAHRMAGYSPRELIGRYAREFIHPEDLKLVSASQRRVLRTCEPDTVVFRLRTKSGGYIWAETTSQGVHDPVSGRVTTVITVTRDVTESVLASRRLKLLQHLTAVANQATTVQDAIQVALVQVCKHLDWPVGHAFVTDRGAGGNLTATDVWHIEEPVRFGHFRRVTEVAPPFATDGLPARVLALGRSLWIEDVSGDPGLAPAAALGIRSALALPIRSGGRVLAVLEFFSPEPAARNERLLEILTEVGGQLGEMLRRLRTEAALTSSELRFRALASTAHDAIVICDEAGRILYSNEGAQRIFGYAPAELIGRKLASILPPTGQEGLVSSIDRFLRTRDPDLAGQTIELTGRRRDGEPVPVELVLSWWQSADGISYTGILRDITLRRQTEQALEEKMAELARSNAELGLFTYIASHDLKEPLRTVASNVQLLQRRLGKELAPEGRKEIDFAIGGVKRMQSLIDDLLAYSRIGTDGKPFAPVDAGPALDQALQSLSVAMQESGGRVTRDRLPTVMADESQLVQLFQNLLSNALKFHGAEAPRVHVMAAQGNGEWVFSVRDNGIGVPHEFAEHIFTVFQRLHSAEEYPGTGIGLAVCRKIVERHRGRIWVESEPGNGSTFRFSIPGL